MTEGTQSTRADPCIALQPPTRADTVPGIVRFDGDDYVRFDAAFASWGLVVPAETRGPRDILDELAKIMGPFAYSSPDASTFHPAMLEPLLREIGARIDVDGCALPRSGGDGGGDAAKDDFNGEAVRVANARAEALDARIEKLISSRRTSYARRAWNAMLLNSTATLVDPDALCRALGVNYDDDFMRECDAAPRDLPDEAGASRTVSREVALTAFRWARTRANAALHEFAREA